MSQKRSKYVNTSPYFTSKNFTKTLLIRKDCFINNRPSLNAVHYPITKNDRKTFKNPKTNRNVTEFQFKVYDLCSQIPEGYVSTYRMLATALSSSPRAVGGALRVNPFAPLPVPCHRVIASNFFIGGFDGEWFGRDDKSRIKKEKHRSEKIDRKTERLAKEGILFNNEGWLIEWQRSSQIFNNFDISKLS
ncbi:13690_t:CDS:2 [Funneliformis geosporum]|uniref:Methylated-DNA--protein-cysteine methyltransferase n=1 Tax=Funneliformis geosporum TaxID=1117311 RepID=A0A9W4SFV0_9GLOM|nr:2470_t:CDS:2 [Funneliformis geosporum]CAI2168166.1 13690_t:CDS:2 [Funneliformis geosporum]